MVGRLQTVFRGLALAVALVLVLIVVITTSPSGFVSPPFFYNDTPSLPRGFYHAEKTDTLAVGDVLRVCVPESWSAIARRRGYLDRGNCPGNTSPMGKMVVALPGDMVDVRPDGVRVDGRLLSGSTPRLKDSQGRDLDPFFGWLVLGPGECFAVNTSYSLSFDSRYFGPVRCVAPFTTLVPAADSNLRVLGRLKAQVQAELLQGHPSYPEPSSP